MHDARDAATVFRTYPGKGIGDARLISEIGFEHWIIGIATRPVETNHEITLLERACEGAPNIARSAGNQDNRFVGPWQSPRWTASSYGSNHTLGGGRTERR